MKHLVIGSRGSALALTQSRTVMGRLNQIYPEIKVELRVIKTTGDNRPDAPLAEIGGLGAFTSEIEAALLDGTIDMAVHCLKDLPTRRPDGLIVAAIAERETPWDVLVTNEGHALETLPLHASVGTSSLRRKAQLLAVRPDLDIRELRGNVPTRLQHVRDGRLDGALLAAAGLKRLGLHNEPGLCELPMGTMLPAPGQGALALEIRDNEPELAGLVGALNDQAAASATTCERMVLQAFGGGCRAPLGTYAQICDNVITLHAFASDEHGARALRIVKTAPLTEAEHLGCEIGATLRNHVTQAPRAHTLEHIRVVVTRASHQAHTFGHSLKTAGAHVFYLPLISVNPVKDVVFPEAPETFDWVIFTSVNTVTYFDAWLKASGASMETICGCHIAAIGEATAQALQESGATPEVVPSKHVSDALVKAVLDAEPSPRGKRVLLPKSDLARDEMDKELTRAGFKVFPVTLYHTVYAAPDNKTMAEITAFNPQVFTFFSPSAVNSFIAAGLQDALHEQSIAPAYVSIGPVTTAALATAGLTPVIEASQQNELSMIEAICQYAAIR